MRILKGHQDILNAVTLLASEGKQRHVPSPSSVTYCTRRNYLWERGWESTAQYDAESWLAAETGRLSEVLLTRIVVAAGAGVPMYDPWDEEGRELTEEEYSIMSFNGGQVDNILTLSDGTQAILELKRKKALDIKRLWQHGLIADDDDYAQCQALMECKGLDLCLFLAANWDRSALTSVTRDMKERPSGFYVEWVQRNPIAVAAIKLRAEIQQGYIKNEDDYTKAPCDAREAWMRQWCPFKGYCDG